MLRHHKRSPKRPSTPSWSVCRTRGKPDKVRAGITKALVPGHELPGVDRRAGGVLLFARGAGQAVLRSHGDIPRAGVFPPFTSPSKAVAYLSVITASKDGGCTPRSLHAPRAFSSHLPLSSPRLCCVFWLYSLLRAKVMLLGAVLLGRSLEARQRLKAAESLQGLFDVRPDQVCKRERGGRQKASGPNR